MYVARTTPGLSLVATLGSTLGVHSPVAFADFAGKAGSL